MKKSTISIFSKALLLIASIFLLFSIFFPLWKIELNAPQYPEGLVLQLYADKIGGDVEIINGLNHYIGMKTLHTENFFEFSVLKYFFIGFSILGILTLIINKKKGVYALFISYLLFIVLAAIDFYRWNYNYGHDLDPNAAIKVPGMAYQPPLLGYKQLLNFGAYSIPDIGGLLLIGAALALLFAVLNETNFLNRFKKKPIDAGLVLVLSFVLMSCNSSEPKPIKLNSDSCDFCKMTISNAKFASELITEKGRCYKFDDVTCMIKYAKENSNTKVKSFFVMNYLKDNQLIPVEKAFFLKGGTIRGPMGGKVIAFDSNENATKNKASFSAEITNWSAIYN
jgi:copper chaperone NosL